MERGEFISVTAASQVLGVSERTTRRWCLAGKLRARKQGRAHIVDPASVAELRQQLAASEGKPVPEIADTAPSPALPAPPLLPLQEASGQPESDTRKERADTHLIGGRAGAALGRVTESPGLHSYQVQSLRSEVEHLAAVAEKLQQANGQLRTTLTILKYLLALGAATGVVLIIGLAVLHQSHDQRILMQERVARAAVERRLAALEQAARPTLRPTSAEASADKPVVGESSVKPEPKQEAAKADPPLLKPRGTSNGTATQVKPETKSSRPRPAWRRPEKR